MARTEDVDNLYRKQILEEVVEYWKQNDYGPSVRDLCKAVGVRRGGRMVSTSVMDYHLDKLESKHLIFREKGVSRSIRPANMEISFWGWGQVEWCEECEVIEINGVCDAQMERDREREQSWYTRLCPDCNHFFDYHEGCEECKRRGYVE